MKNSINLPPIKKEKMKNINWKKILPHVIAVAIFLVVAVIYCKPAMEGKVLQQADVTQWKSMAQNQQVEFEKTGRIPLWSNGMFSGMPGYMIKGNANNVLPWHVMNIITLWTPRPVMFFFLASICFYILSQVLRSNSRAGTAISLCYAYATYNAVIIAEGHETKMIALAVLPAMIGGILLVFDKRYWLGIVTTAIFSSILFSQKHYQITYYAILIVAIMSLAFAIRWIMQKAFKHLIFAAVFSLSGVVLGTLSNAVVILPDNEYTSESIRGGSQLADAKTKNTKEGLSKDYAFSYSVYKTEPFAMLIPHIFGGSSKMEVAEDKSKAVASLQEMNPQIAQQLQSALSFYWGGIGGTSGPPYVGAIVIFLALLGFVIVDSKYKWWILATTLLTIVMSWGSYFEGFNNFLYNHLPLYNKFRAPSMILVVPTFLFNMMAILALQKIIETEDKTALLKNYKKGLMLTGGVFAVLVLLYLGYDYKGESDINLIKSINSIPDANTKAAFLEAGNQLVKGLKEDRQSLFLVDIFRSLFFIAIAGLGIWLSIKKKIQNWILILLIGFFAFVDIIIVDVKYLNSENYLVKEESETNLNPTEADKFILQDKSDYRVFDVSNGAQSAINYGARPAYFHQSVGGYHPAKLSIYQDLAENQLYNYPNCMPVLNMLNTKYIIHSLSSAQQVEPNANACGSAWFIKSLKKVNTAREEMDALTTLNVKDTAVISKGFDAIADTKFSYDSASKIELVKKLNDVVTYKTKTSSTQFVVFSEIYYSKGWTAYVDGKETPYAKVNYVLRGMPIPAGEHEIVYKFEPKSHALGEKLTSISSIIILLLILAAAFFEWKRRKQTMA